MIQITKKIEVFVLAAFLLLVLSLNSSAEEIAPKTQVGPKHDHIASWSRSFCLNSNSLLKGSWKATGADASKETLALGLLKRAIKNRPYQKAEEETVEEIEEGPIDPRRLFVVPVADVLRSLEINMGGGSAFGVRKEETRPFLGHIRLGLGGVAEVELSTMGIINELAEGSSSIPMAAFKIRFISEGKLRPSVAAALQSSLWDTEERDGIVPYGTVKFQKRLSTLYFVASKTFEKVSMHAGLSVSDLRIRTLEANDTPISPASGATKDYFNKNLFGPFIGLRIELNPKTFLMMEAEQIASYEFDETIPFVSEDDINVEWMGITGVRFFFFDWLALDTGVMYRSDYHGIGDAHIQAGLNVSLSLPRVVKSLWGER